MPYFVTLKTPFREPGIQVLGPFDDLRTAEAQPQEYGGQPAPGRVVEAADAEVARSLAEAAFGPGNPDA